MVADTPNCAGPNFGMPTFPVVTCNNGPNGDMFMNYMDYTDDAAMFMFTAQQVAADARRARDVTRRPDVDSVERRQRGSAKCDAADTSPQSTNPTSLFTTRWVHLYEQDSAAGDVYRARGRTVPLSRRPRERLEFTPDGTAAVISAAGPDDRYAERPRAGRTRGDRRWRPHARTDAADRRALADRLIVEPELGLASARRS